MLAQPAGDQNLGVFMGWGSSNTCPSGHGQGWCHGGRGMVFCFFFCYGIPVGTVKYVKHVLNEKVEEVKKEVNRGSLLKRWTLSSGIYLRCLCLTLLDMRESVQSRAFSRSENRGNAPNSEQMGNLLLKCSEL